MSLFGVRTNSLPPKRFPQAEEPRNPLKNSSGPLLTASDEGQNLELALERLSLSAKLARPEVDYDLAAPGSTSVSTRTLLVNYQFKSGRARSRSEASIDELITLKIEFIKEAHRLYLKDTERPNFKVTCKDGVFYDEKGDFLNGEFIFTLMPNFELYAAKVALKKHHSYFNCGLPVRGAGIMYVNCGRLITLSNESGHYRPTFEEMICAIQWFTLQVKGQHFLFEDHSRQDEHKEFKGILYFLLNHAQGDDRFQLELIENAHLVPTLHMIVKSAMESYLYVRNLEVERQRLLKEQQREHQRRLFPDASDVETDDDEMSSNESTYFTPINMETLVKPMKGPDIFANPDLLQYVCLKNVFNNKFVSRYGCKLKSKFEENN